MRGNLSGMGQQSALNQVGTRSSLLAPQWGRRTPSECVASKAKLVEPSRLDEQPSGTPKREMRLGMPTWPCDSLSSVAVED
jgi:hypothetical protein